MSPSSPIPTKIGVVLFPGFQLLDWAGPMDAFAILSLMHTLELYTIASTLDPISTQNHHQDVQGSQFASTIVPSHTFATAPKDLDVLLIPGGVGSRIGPGCEERMAPVVEYLKTISKGQGEGEGEGTGPKWILTVCTGSEVLARTGLLDGRRATTNKKAFNLVKSLHPSVNWVAKARWVVDGNVWTSSGISAGMDLAFAWIAEVFGEETASEVADRSEYERNGDAGDDRFAERWGAV